MRNSTKQINNTKNDKNETYELAATLKLNQKNFTKTLIFLLHNTRNDF